MTVVRTLGVVICFQISIFEPLETTQDLIQEQMVGL